MFVANRSADRKLTLWVEPIPDQYDLKPGEEICVEGRLERNDDAVVVEWHGDDLVVYDDCSEGNEVVITMNGALRKPDNTRA